MHFSIDIPNFGDFADAQDRGIGGHGGLERAGWDALFVWDHIVHRKQLRRTFGDPWMLLTAAALATSRIRLGTLITPVARRRPSNWPARWPPSTRSAAGG